MDNLQTVAAAYSNLEYDVERGERGTRYGHLEALLCSLTGAEAALVVNNNAAACVPGSAGAGQGQGGDRCRAASSSKSAARSAFPTSCAAAAPSCARVGSTNKTHRRDYAAAVSADAALLPACAHQQLPHRRLYRRGAAAGPGGAGAASTTCRSWRTWAAVRWLICSPTACTTNRRSTRWSPAASTW